MQKLWKYADTRGGHDIDHIRRVYRRAEQIAAEEGAGIDADILFPAVILHDIARDDEDNDPTGKTDHALLGAERAAEILKNEGLSPANTEKICACIRTHRYSSEGTPPESIEAKILFDADKLDCLGAVGVARLFMLSGQYGERLYVPPPPGWGSGAKVFRISDLREYSANLEYTGKMRFVPDRLFTASARRMSVELLARMDSFFELLSEELSV